jgi:hypothetical protein
MVVVVRYVVVAAAVAAVAANQGKSFWVVVPLS